MSAPVLSEDELNAFVDGQLSAADRARVLEAIDRDEALQKRVAEIQQTRSLLRHAYERPPLRQRVTPATPSWGKQMLAAALLVSIGAVTGGVVQRLAGGRLAPAVQTVGTPKGVVIQVSKNDPAEWEMALTNARNVRKAYGDQPMEVEIVAYGPGLKMLRSDSPVAARLEQARQEGVKLLACGNTMRATHTTREDLNWLVDVVPAGIVEIMQKQSEGFAYVRP
jgi:intracellular sulfur oxidation DsrE/DsrF family protein